MITFATFSSINLLLGVNAPPLPAKSNYDHIFTITNEMCAFCVLMMLISIILFPLK